MPNPAEKEIPERQAEKETFNLHEQLMGDSGFKPEDLQPIPEQEPVEQTPEIQKEVPVENFPQEEIEEITQVSEEIPSQIATTTAGEVTHSQTYTELKTILDDKLDAYLVHLSPEDQQRIGKEQEKVLQQLEEMVDKFVFRARDILKLIKKWLGLIPGLNSFFQIQDAKIKAERVVEYAKRKHNQTI